MASGRTNLEKQMLSRDACEEVDQQDVTSHDILLGRTRRSKSHTGNVAFRTLVDARTELYRSSTSRSAKIHVVVSLTKSVYEAGGRFLNPRKKGNSTVWVEVDRSYAREKVGNSIRDGIKLTNKNKKPPLSAGKYKNLFNQTSSFADIVHCLVRDANGREQRPSDNVKSRIFPTHPMSDIPSFALPSTDPIANNNLGLQHQEEPRTGQREMHSPQLEASPSLDSAVEESKFDESRLASGNHASVLDIFLEELPPETTDLDDLSSILTLDRLDGLDDFDDDSSFAEWMDEEGDSIMHSSYSWRRPGC